APSAVNKRERLYRRGKIEASQRRAENQNRARPDDGSALERMTSDLENEKWAVLSDRGCEATRLTHEEARRLVHKLASEGRHGLCVVTNNAARRMAEVPAKRATLESRER